MENQNDIVRDLLVCECSSMDHQLVINYFKGDTDPFVYVHVHLSHKGFLERIKYAFRYIFGFKSTYGAFEEVILGPEHVTNLLTIVNHIKEVETQNAITA